MLCAGTPLLSASPAGLLTCFLGFPWHSNLCLPTVSSSPPSLCPCPGSSFCSRAQRGSSLPYPGDPTFSPVGGALPAQGFPWDVEEEGSRDSVCLLTPVCAAHHG